MKNIVLCFLSIFGIIDVSMAKDVYIQLQNNKYQMQNICFSMNKITDKEKKFARYYKFTFTSTYNVFENYQNVTYIDNVIFKTDLYTIKSDYLPFSYSDENNTPVITRNKKVIEIVLNEDEMKKLYEANSVKIIFDKSIFSREYITEITNHQIGTLSLPYVSYLQPVISISLNKSDFDNELNECTKKFNVYSNQFDEYHSKPMNRIKTFFNF